MPAGEQRIAEPLRCELERRKTFSSRDAIDLLKHLSACIVERHDSGRLHLYISTDSVLFDPDNGEVVLSDPPAFDRSFGDADCDDDFCPPELQGRNSVRLAAEIAPAREALSSAGLPQFNPQRIDFYQLGSLLCRMLTGREVSAFLSSPRVAAKVPAEARDFIERALGHDTQRAFRTSAEFVDALSAIDAIPDGAMEEVVQRSTGNVGRPDTTPSFANGGNADTDTGRAPAPHSEDEEFPFRKLGHYEIVGRLGRGGMGDVYKGYEPQLDRHVAIKVLPTEFTRQEEMVKRFYAEASAAAKLIHPNTVEIHFIGKDVVQSGADQTPATLHYFAMRYVEGESLADLLARRKRLNVNETLAILEQALAGLNAAHRLGMVHRDIKPGNILIDHERQRVLLADFGLVKSLQGAASMTASGVIVGTVDYMPPEQGRGASVDARADLYAIGVVMFQMLSGRLPFAADSPSAMIFQHVYEAPPALDAIATDIPSSVSQIVAKLLSKSPDARYQNVDALLADLRAIREGQPPHLRSSGPTAPVERPRSVIIAAPRFADEPRLPATILQLAAPRRSERMLRALQNFFLIPSEEFVQRIQTTENQVDGAIAEYERRQASLSKTVEQAEGVVRELDTEREVWKRAIDEAVQRSEQVDDDAARRAALGEKLRGERVLAELSEQFESQAAQLAEMRQKLSHVTATLVRLRSQRDVLNARLKVAQARVHLAGGRSKPSGGWRRGVQRMRWRNVAIIFVSMITVGACTLKFIRSEYPSSVVTIVIPAVDLQPVKFEEKFKQGAGYDDLFFNPPNVFAQPLVGSDKNVVDLAVGPGGKLIAAATGGKSVYLWDAESGHQLPSLSGRLREVNAVALSSDDSLLATGESSSPDDSTIKLWNPMTGELVWQVPGFNEWVTHVAFQPGGSLLAASFFTAVGKKPIVWDFESRQPYWEVPVTNPDSSKIVISPDGTLLAGLNKKGELFVGNLPERTLKMYPLGVRGDLAFVGQTSHLVLTESNGSILTVDARTGAVVSRFESVGADPRSIPHSITSSHDGRWLATANTKWIEVIDTQSGLPRTILRGHQTTNIAFSPSGNWLTTAGGAPFVARWPTQFQPVEANGPGKEAIVGPMLAAARDKPLALVNTRHAVCLWNFGKQSPLIPLKLPPLQDVEHSSAVFSSDARQVAVIDSRGNVSISDVLSGDRIHQVQIPTNASRPMTSAIAFSEDAKLVWVATSSGLWRVDPLRPAPETWMDWPTGTEIRSLSSGGRFAVTINQNSKLQIWDVPTRRSVIEEHISAKITSVAFTNDGQWLLAADEGGSFSRWNLEQYERTERFQIEQSNYMGALSMAFLPGQNNLAVVLTSHARLAVVDVVRKETIARFHLKNAEVASDADRNSTRVWMSPDGNYAITSAPGLDRVLFWDFWIQQHL